MMLLGLPTDYMKNIGVQRRYVQSFDECTEQFSP